MKVTAHGRPNGESYEMRKGYDPDADTEFLVRIYDDGHVTVSTRSGEGRTELTWSPETPLLDVVA